MLKLSMNRFRALLCAFLLGYPVFAQAPEQIQYLHLRRDAEGVTLLGASAYRGQMKPEVQGGPLEYETDEGFRSGLPDPLLQRYEYEDPSEPGRIRSLHVERASAEFTIRVPGRMTGQNLRFFQRHVPRSGELAAQGAREFLGEIRVPAAAENLRAAASSAKLSTLLTNGPTGSRLNVAILAEGFRASEERAFTNQAKAVLEQFLDTSPYREYRDHFNAFAIFVASVESGSDHPSRQIFRNTYFNSSYDSYGLDRLITIPPNERNSSYSAGQGKVATLLGQFVPDYDIVLLLVNDSEYGGAGGFPSIASIDPWSAEIAIHEVGHSFGGLGDEYDSPYPGFPETEEPNTTKQTNRASIKWRNWIDPFTPIPTPDSSTYESDVGLFEGAHYHSTDWYRPKRNCKMRSLEHEFCEVCKEALVLATYTKLSIIHGSSPAQNNVTVPGGGELRLQVHSVPPAEGTVRYIWTVDGATNLAFASDQFPASFATLGVGTRLVRAQASDPTALVRTDTSGRLQKSRSWLVQVLSETNQPPAISTVGRQEIGAGETSGPIAFTVSDPDSPVTALTATARSSDQTLIPDANLTMSGNGANRTITIGTIPGSFGTAIVTLEVSDGLNQVASSFEVAVIDDSSLMLDPIADRREFSAEISVALPVGGKGYGPLTFSATSTNPLLIPISNIRFASANGDHVANIAPVNGGAGSSDITITATDGILAASQTFQLTFLARPTVVGVIPEVTADFIRLQFNSDVRTTMILESSSDMKFWSPVSTQQDVSNFEYLIPRSEIAGHLFFRLRLAPL